MRPAYPLNLIRGAIFIEVSLTADDCPGLIIIFPEVGLSVMVGILFDVIQPSILIKVLKIAPVVLILILFHS